MKYYKLIKDATHYPSFTPNKIYPEGFAPKNNLCDVGIHYRSNLNNGSWIEVPAGDYFVQEGRLPERLTIKRVADDPLWKKYINWLNKICGLNLTGNDHSYYGFKTDEGNYYATSNHIIEKDDTELTLKQWDKIVNKNIKEEFELPEKWCVRIDKQEVVDYCNVHGLYPPYKIVEDGTTYAHFPGWNDCTTCNGIKPGYTEITYSQFVKHILNKEVMEENKEIIGWKLKKDCQEYSRAASNICAGYINDHGMSGAVGYEGDIEKLKKAGVLELWFEPIYKEKILKFGGYDVTFEKATSGVRISCNGETGTFSQIQAIYNYFKPNSTYFKFGSQEIKRVEYADGAAWNLDSESDNPTNIKIGCTTGTWEEFVAIHGKAKSML